MFLACSYFLRNLSLNVLISMVLIKKKCSHLDAVIAIATYISFKNWLWSLGSFHREKVPITTNV